MATAPSSYELGELLYESRNSLVHRSFWGVDSRPVILKILRQVYPSPLKVAWFKREYQITRSLSQPGIIEVLALEQAQHRWLMVLEDFGGQSCTSLGLNGSLSIDQFLTMAIQLSETLGQVHQQQIIHKDINPSNIILNAETGQLKLIDFGISTNLSRENPTLQPPSILEGTLAYISPEQTGRMNRAIDYRTDFYSLGVTFYELVTGQLPFSQSDAMALVHAHLAVEPQPPHKLRADIPVMISEIILKLMAKNAEDRYQTAAGLQADLEACQQARQVSSEIAPFSLGRADISNQFQTPQRLYGREAEIETLLAAFERASQATGELMLIAGSPGIGKTALVQEIYRPLTRHEGYFIAGKFDQFQRTTPYASLIQAFQALIRQLLTESETKIENWRQAMKEALGMNGRAISEVIPDLELILGPQPPLPELPPVEAQNRFNLTFQNFIQVFTRPEHPLILFLDDLQWADSASLQLLQRLIGPTEPQHLFIIGTYRENEVDEAHPLQQSMAAIRENGGHVNQIFLKPLDFDQISAFVADALGAPPAQAESLAQLVAAKTNGNPFFMNEFLKALYREDLLRPTQRTAEDDHSRGTVRWQWDIAELQARDITDNVVELMADRLRDLSAAAQTALQQAACIGPQFDLQTLALVAQQPPPAAAATLQPAVEAGLIIPLNDEYKLVDFAGTELPSDVNINYKFAHDRVRQAAYLLIPEPERQSLHLQIGRLLFDHIEPAQHETRIFEIVQQLNLGLTQLTDQTEKEQVAELNLIAGQKARQAVAYQAALSYFQTGLSLLNEESWERRYELTLALSTATAEAAYLTGKFEQMDQPCQAVLQHARTLPERAPIYEIQLQAYGAQYDLANMVETGLATLKLYGIEFPEQPGQADVMQAFGRISALLGDRPIASLIDQPVMTDPLKQSALRIMAQVGVVASVGYPDLYPLLILNSVQLSLEHGQSSMSAPAYTTYGIMLCGAVGDIEAGYQFGKLALALLERENWRDQETKTHYMYNTFIRHWKEPLQETIKPFLSIYQSGLETGDLTFASVSTFMYIFHSFWAGRELTALLEQLSHFGQWLSRFPHQQVVLWHQLYRQTILALQGQTNDPRHLESDDYHEADRLSRFEAANDRLALCFTHLNKMLLCYLMGDYAQAVAESEAAEAYLGMAIAMHTIPLFHFYDSLVRLAYHAEADEAERTAILEKVAANQAKLHTWMQFGPMNLQHRYHLVEAERARVLGQPAEARNHYDQAVILAQAHDFTHDLALAYELAGRFYQSNGLNHLARHLLRDAHYTYLQWGATAKAAALKTQFPHFLALAPEASPSTPAGSLTTTTQQGSSVLDLASVLKATQAISSEIMLDRLLATLMKIVIENAGAQRGFLLLEEKGEWLIEVEGTAEPNANAEVIETARLPVDKRERLAASVVNFVARTRESVVLNDVTREGLFTRDPYVRQHEPKSLLCMPLLNQGNLIGILYLENNLTTGAFTPARQEVLYMLSSQAAISIENARLYAHQVALTNGYSRFVPRDFLRILNKGSIVEVQLSDHVQHEAAILFSDIRDFTTLSEPMTPQENFDFVNDYLGRVSPVIREYRGFIVKYLGDGMMAVFPERLEDALDASIAKLRAVEQYNQERQALGEPPIRIGIGVHTGRMTLGTVGEAERLQGDLLSDAVNLASRLEGLTKLYGAALIVSAEALMKVEDPGRYRVRFLGSTQVKGRQEAVSIFELLDGEPDTIAEQKWQTKGDFEQALMAYYEGRFNEASDGFSTVLHHSPTDTAARLYLSRTKQLLTNGVPVGWTGVEALLEK